jgi:hypothetical protein
VGVTETGFVKREASGERKALVVEVGSRLQLGKQKQAVEAPTVVRRQDYNIF